MERGKKSAKRIHQIGMTMLLYAILAIECDAVSLITGFLISFAGAALMLATMKGTGWYE